MQNYFGLDTFSHFVDFDNSAYFMVNKENPSMGFVTEMQRAFSDLYPGLFNLSFTEL